MCLSEDSKGIYLVGGFGKNRLILDNVSYLCLESLKLTELPNLPTQMYSPAVCCLGGRLFVIKNQIFVYRPNTKSWSKMDNLILPQHMEFKRALVHGNYIYLTGNHAYELYRFNPDRRNPTPGITTVDDTDEVLPDTEQKEELEFLGKFANEAQNVCVVGNTIYNFSTDQFDYNSAIETFDIETKRFNVAWETDSDEFDFSPYHSSGCFPLVIY